MGKPLKQYVAISGSTGFVGKNLLKFLIQKKLKCIPVLRSDLQEGELEIGQISGLMNEIKPAAEVVEEIWQEFLSAKNELQNLSV